MRLAAVGSQHTVCPLTEEPRCLREALLSAACLLDSVHSLTSPLLTGDADRRPQQVLPWTSGGSSAARVCAACPQGVGAEAEADQCPLMRRLFQSQWSGCQAAPREDSELTGG